MLVFRGLHLDDATQVAFSKRLGRVEVFGKGDAPRDLPDHARPGQEPHGCLPARDVRLAHRRLHRRRADHGDDPQRPRGGRVGGETEFASTYTAFDDLSDEEKERCLSLRVVHSFEAAQRMINDDPTPEELALWRTRPSKEHPLVWTHASGRRSLVLGATTSHVAGMDVEEGRALLDDLLARSTTPDRVYRHHWSVGDLVIWDNRGVLHRACPYDAASPRDMHRTTLHGEEPIQ